MKYKEKGMDPVCRIILAMFLLTAAGCGSPSLEVYRDQNMDIGSVYTVAVMPFVNLSRDQLAAERVRDVFMTMILADGRVYVVPPGEVARQVSMVGIVNSSSPTNEDVIRLGKILKTQGIITGVIKEYGEVRAGSATANVISLSVQLTEVDTGKVVGSVSSTKGGIGFVERLFGGGGEPMNVVTEKAIKDVIRKLLQ
jgi:hypothetical protein